MPQVDQVLRSISVNDNYDKAEFCQACNITTLSSRITIINTVFRPSISFKTEAICIIPITIFSVLQAEKCCTDFLCMESSRLEASGAKNKTPLTYFLLCLYSTGTASIKEATILEWLLSPKLLMEVTLLCPPLRTSVWFQCIGQYWEEDVTVETIQRMEDSSPQLT